jgi:hypothetical protein
LIRASTLFFVAGIKPRNCTEMRVLTCVKKPLLEKPQIAGTFVEPHVTGAAAFFQGA